MSLEPLGAVEGVSFLDDGPAPVIAGSVGVVDKQVGAPKAFHQGIGEPHEGTGWFILGQPARYGHVDGVNDDDIRRAPLGDAV